jgi:hypothetical protein
MRETRRVRVRVQFVSNEKMQQVLGKRVSLVGLRISEGSSSEADLSIGGVINAIEALEESESI